MWGSTGILPPIMENQLEKTAENQMEKRMDNEMIPQGKRTWNMRGKLGFYSGSRGVGYLYQMSCSEDSC